MRSPTQTARLVAGRLAAATALAALLKLLGTTAYRLPVVGYLGTTSVGFVALSVLFGAPGLAAATLVQAVYTSIRHPRLDAYWLASVGGYFFAGLLAVAAFRGIPWVRRDLDDLRSLGVFAVVAGLGALISSAAITWTGGESPFWAETLIWARSTLVSVWLFAPPLVVLGARWLGPLRVGPPPRKVGVSGPILVPLAGIAALTTVIAGLAHYAPQVRTWVELLFLMPLYWAARRWQVPGGLVAAAGIGLVTLAFESAGAAPTGPTAALEVYARLLPLWFVGAFVGVAQRNEADRQQALEDRNRELRLDLQRVVTALTGAVETKDGYTEGHLHRVASYALEVGSRLGMSERELELLQIGSALHDVGKIGIPEPILNKPGPLDPGEVEIMRRHPEIGARLLAKVDGLAAAAPLVHHHQERWDGRTDGPFPGYPAGLAGEAIPLGARIIAVVDAFDAMTTDRPYRAALPLDRARQTLLAERGRQFDPTVVDAFLAVVSARPWAAG